jgi:hypothetical protein
MVKELERFNWWLIYNIISSGAGNLMILVLRSNL